MNNIQPKQNDFQNNKRARTELPITIVTDEEYKTGDNLELIRQRIEKAALYVHSLFNSIRYSLENLPSFDDRKVEETIWDARSVCEIGYGVADSILAGVSGLTEFQPDEDPEKYTIDAGVDQLALLISGLLNNPDLPPPIYSGFANTMTDFFNEHVDENDFADDTTSAEYIARLLASYKKKDAAN